MGLMTLGLVLWTLETTSQTLDVANLVLMGVRWARRYLGSLGLVGYRR